MAEYDPTLTRRRLLGCASAFALTLSAVGTSFADDTKAPTVEKVPNRGGPGQLTPDTSIKLLVLDRYKSGTSKPGDRVNLRVDEDVTDTAGNILIRKSTPAYGTVTQSKGAGIFGKRGLLDISIDYTSAIDGSKVKLRASKSKQGKSNTGISVAAIVLIAPVALFIKGSNVSLDPGTPIMAYVDEPATVRLDGSAPSAGSDAKPVGPQKVLTLRNGDKITGTIDGLSGGIYTVTTRNGTLKIKADDVKEITDGADGSRGGKK